MNEPSLLPGLDDYLESQRPTIINLSIKCQWCPEIVTMVVDRRDYDRFRKPRSPHVQVIFPYLSDNELEMLISQTCPKCWPPEPEDDEEAG